MKKNILLTVSCLLFFVLTGSAQLAVTTTSTNVSCASQCTGSATANPSGGVPPYTYTWASLGLSNATAVNLCAGTYSVSVKDNLGATAGAIVTITEPAALSSVMSPGNTTCNGGSNGSVYITVNGGTTPYNYSWSPGGATTTIMTNLTAGTYTCHVTDAKGCTYLPTTIVNEPAAITYTTSQVNVSCNTGANGSATVMPTGGNAPYFYSWTPSGGNGNTASGLVAGTYSCSLNDYNGCAGPTAVVTITEPLKLAGSTTQTNVSCNAGSDGTATASASGGTTPYTYSWHPNGGLAATATGLTASMYTCFITDANGCNLMANVTLSEPSGLSASPAPTNVNCAGGNDGSINITANGGTPPYTYSFLPNAGTSNPNTGMTAGTYTCTVTDSHGCTSSKGAVITEPAAIVITPTSSASTCGASTGYATVSVSGGVPNIMYSWSPGTGSNAPSYNNLAQGIYTCTVTDGNGCIKMSQVTIANTNAATVNASPVNVLCYGASTGSIVITASGGTPGYTYIWSPNVSTSANAGSLAAGNYVTTVKDAAGCQTSITTTLTQPANALSGTTSFFQPTCNGNSNGQATATASGGSAPYTYTWMPGNIISSFASGLVAGTYTCTILDNNSCQTAVTATITEPAAIVANVTAVPTTCYGTCTGSASSAATGGFPPLRYSWTVGPNASSVSGLCAGTYNCNVMDNNECSVNAAFTITEAAPMPITTSSVNVTCNGLCNGSTTVTATSVAPYTYSWTGTSQTTATATGLCAGTYSVKVTDGKGCIDSTHTALVTQPNGLSAVTNANNSACAACTGSATSTVSGGNVPYSYSWSAGGQTASTATGLCPGSYTLGVTDAKGCTVSTSGIINGSASPMLTGKVTAQFSGTVTSGMVYLVQYDSVLKRQHLIDSVTITNTGRYTFNNSIGGKFLVYAIPTKASYPNTVKTYSPSIDQWSAAAIVSAACATQDTANILVIETPVLAGTGSFSGTVRKDIGYSPRWSGTTPIVLVPGDPVPGLDVNLEQHPGGIIAQLVTDNNGFYHFTKVPAGTFDVVVDIPGLGMVSQYTRTVTSNEMYPNLNYRIDSIHIHPDTTLATAIPVSAGSLTASFNLAPNPFKDQVNVSYTLTESSDVHIQIYNALGQVVTQINKPKQDAGTYSIQVNASDNNLIEGVYLVHLSMNGKTATKRLVRLN
jgi:hypothetical protein